MKKLYTILSSLLLTLSLNANDIKKASEVSKVSEDCLSKYTATVETAEIILVSMERGEYGNVFEYNELLKVSVEVSKQSCRYEGKIMLGLEGLENQSHTIDSVLSKIEN